MNTRIYSLPARLLLLRCALPPTQHNPIPGPKALAALGGGGRGTRLRIIPAPLRQPAAAAATTAARCLARATPRGLLPRKPRLRMGGPPPSLGPSRTCRARRAPARKSCDGWRCSHACAANASCTLASGCTYNAPVLSTHPFYSEPGRVVLAQVTVLLWCPQSAALCADAWSSDKGRSSGRWSEAPVRAAPSWLGGKPACCP
eukprot:scaffold518_cov388-Prasinococcus_capsulatus_cf.AAC.29